MFVTDGVQCVFVFLGQQEETDQTWATVQAMAIELEQSMNDALARYTEVCSVFRPSILINGRRYVFTLFFFYFSSKTG